MLGTQAVAHHSAHRVCCDAFHDGLGVPTSTSLEEILLGGYTSS